ncbi:PP2C family protein-serine/threonine phosphatase [Micromonospora sp. NPDC023956]|uniref:PP2C family protein-serine/threonine phosphatase n=1 Tax=Micromonospora sp. NPDC023956 TaxID=3155722 RepID=UPI0033C94885
MDELFDAAGSLRSAYSRVDWATTPLGPVAGWSRTLRAAVDIALHTRFPVTLLWGPEFVMLYNEAYVDLIGNKHPTALGAPAARVFPEVWDEIGPMLESVRTTRRATWTRNMRLLMDRHGYLEECFFTFSYSAVQGVDRQVEGVIDIASETTGQVLSQRRLVLLAVLTDALGALEEPEQILDRAVSVLRDDPHDLLDVDVLLPRAAGGPPPATPPPVFGAGDVVVDGVAGTARVRVRLPRVSGAGDGAVLVARLSQHLPVDEGYLRFVRLVGATVTQALHRAHTRQAERRMATLERELSEKLQHSLLTPPAQPAGLEVAVRYRPATEWAHIGGDWYDSFLQPDGSLALVIGDVAGHDRQAAATMAQIRNLLRGVAYGRPASPAAVLAGLDRAMGGLRVDAFATAILARVEPGDQPARPGTHTLGWANAGHPPPVLVAPDGRTSLLMTPPEVLLGLSGDVVRTDHRVTLAPGSTVVFYTDGLIERRGTVLDEGLADLTDALADQHGSTAEQVCDHLLGRYPASGEDDIALVVLRIPPTPVAGSHR